MGSAVAQPCADLKADMQAFGAYQVVHWVKNLPATREMQETVQSLGGEVPLEEGMATHSSILPGESYGWKSLAGYSSWGHRAGHS